VSGKHNDLEEVGRTARHHTFFEMLGNFSFGDYFKRDAIDFAWRLFTEEYGLPKDRLWATVHHSDDEAYALWQEVAGLPESGSTAWATRTTSGRWGTRARADRAPRSISTCARRGAWHGPHGGGVRGRRVRPGSSWSCGTWCSCSSTGAPTASCTRCRSRPSTPAPGWSGSPACSRAWSNYETDLFQPLIERAVKVVGRAYEPDAEDGVSYRVLADHARATAFLLADGVFPSNSERGYVLRRVMRRGIRHAWLLGRREPTLVEVVDEVVTSMGEAYPELEDAEGAPAAGHADGGGAVPGHHRRGDAPVRRAGAGEADAAGGGVMSGEDAFRLYDTYGFPIDLTELMAEERGYRVDMAGFEASLEEQRQRSRRDREARGSSTATPWPTAGRSWTAGDVEQEFVGYEAVEVETEVVAFRRENGRAALQLRRTRSTSRPGGQVSDRRRGGGRRLAPGGG
jgi:alanyl-tRNA synthetase